jgi:toxin FitB
MTFLCDTNVISELSRAQPNSGVVEWASSCSQITISVITLEEIRFGLSAKPNRQIEDWFQQFLQNYCTLLPITTEIAQRAGNLRGELRRQGMQRTQADMLIAATAQMNQLTLVTRNTRDFECCGILLLNPFR